MQNCHYKKLKTFQYIHNNYYYFYFYFSQVVFEGIRGDGFEGDIAIDDVSVTKGKCKQEMPPATGWSSSQ